MSEITDNIDKQEIENLANKQGFNVYFEDSPLKKDYSITSWTLGDGEIACVCKRCSFVTILSTKEATFNQKLCNLKCQNPECEQTSPDYTDRTKGGELIWCADIMRLFWCFETVDYDQLDYILKDGHKFHFGEKDKSETYVAYDSQMEDSLNVLIFTVYPSAEDEWLSKYKLYSLNAKISAGTQPGTVHLLYPKDFEALYCVIKNSIQSESSYPVNALLTYDTYLSLNSLLYSQDQALWSRLRKVVERTQIANDILQEQGEPCFLDELADKRLEKFINEHRCPVCEEPFRSYDRTCFRCGFDGLNVDFLNQQDAEEWRINKLYPFKLHYLLKKVKEDIQEMREEKVDDHDN